MRLLWWRYDEGRKEAVKAARISRGRYRCADCRTELGLRDIEVDHIFPVGPTPGSRLGKGLTWDVFMERLFVPANGLQILCSWCHMKKTLDK